MSGSESVRVDSDQSTIMVCCNNNIDYPLELVL